MNKLFLAISILSFSSASMACHDQDTAASAPTPKSTTVAKASAKKAPKSETSKKSGKKS